MRGALSGRCASAFSLGLLLLIGRPVFATPATLFSQMANESPVRGEPGDLLLLAGTGFAATDTVVYAALSDTTQALTHPASVPPTSTATSGVASVVSTLNVPDSLAVSLPSVMTTKQSYALWVRNSSGEWSNGVRINDARPMWISPDRVYVTAQVASLPRYLKVIGRNLAARTGSTTQVKLTGPTTYTLTAADDGNSTTTIENYVAYVTLPMTILAGTYTVSVSRDGVSWVPLSGQTLTVAANSPTVTSFPVGSYGGCTPNDAVDDTACVLNAIAAAKTNGGTVTFAAGTWIIDSSSAAGVTADGIVVPPNVNLSGAGTGVTIVERGTDWNRAATFTLQGSNVVQGITFRDLNTYVASSPATQMLQLGVGWQRAAASGLTSVSNVTITHNVFDKPYFGIVSGSLPMDHIFVTYNEFGAFREGVNLSGDGGNVAQKFHTEDSIFDFNTFKPGSYSMPIASELASGHRFDMSNNVVDGATTTNQYLYHAGTDPTGWRAAFFWSMQGSYQNMLVAQNTITCPGDKGPDGEAIAYDGNHNIAALPAAQSVISATTNTVAAAGPLTAQLGTLTLPPDYFSEHWVTVADGPGKGQVRRIVSYTVGASGTPVTFTVTPAWDVIPQTTSRILVEREYWQVYTVDNSIDQRQPLCTKGNTSKPMGGVIGLYGPWGDSAIEGNQQHDTSGIFLYNQYTVTDSVAGTVPGYSFQYFVDVRNNTVDHEYNWDAYCSWSGIEVDYQAGPTAGSSPPTEAYGVSIAHNTVAHSDGLDGGAIVFSPGWWEGPAPTNWNLVESTLVFGNSISDVSGAAAGAPTVPYTTCNATANPRVGVNVFDSHVFHAVLASNSCTSVSTLLQDNGTNTQKICTAINNSCECPAGLVGYWKFDEGLGTTTADSSGNGDGGTLVNGPVWTTGRTGSALSFAATTSSVSVNGGGSLADLYNSGHGMTVTAWIKPASAGGGGGGRIVDKDNNDGGWFLKMNGATSLQFAGDQFTAVGSVQGKAVTLNSTNSIVLNQWQHVAATWDGTTNAQGTNSQGIHLYVNGVLADDATSAVNGTGAPQTDAGTPFTIGNRPVDNARNFNGSIDGVRVYNRILTQAEIQSLVNGGS
jgi:hypothetical protein